MHLTLFDELFTFFSPKSLTHLDKDDTKLLLVARRFRKIYRNLLLRIWHFLIIFCFYFSPKSLAHYLKLLDADDAKFNEYFWWRDFYARRFRHHQAMCDVCEKLHSPDKETKIYQARLFNIAGLHTQARRNIKGVSKNLRIINGRIKTTSGPFFCQPNEYLSQN